MHTLQGIAVSSGIAIGESLIIDNEGFRIPDRVLAPGAVDRALTRLNKAVESVAREIALNRDTVSNQLGEQYGAIFSAHLQLLRDPKLRGEIENHIRQDYFTPEHAVSRTFRRYAKVFEDLKDNGMAQRAHDLFDIEKRLLRALLGRQREELSGLTSPVILLAHDLTPSETAALKPEFVLGFVTEMGGSGGHTAIVAEALGIPAVVGTGSFLGEASGGDTVIVDGDQGIVIFEPDEETLAGYRREIERRHDTAVRLESLRDLPAETRDGTRVELMANIEFPQEVEACHLHGADGIGLYRTEFLYVEATRDPTEEDQYAAYVRVIQAMGDRPVVIRTLDLGADKMGLSVLGEEEHNPFLGLRSIRLSLRNLPLFRVQLRAVLRASVLGNVRLMFPLIATLPELRQAKMVLADVMEDLAESDVPFDKNIPVGMMVEVPSAVLMLDHFLPEVDFVSIGTNDLIQYTLAVDRSNKEVAGLYSAADPAVIRLISRTLSVANEAGVEASLCGQMSGNPLFTMLLLGLGLRTFSVAPAAIPEIKRVCREATLDRCKAMAERVLTMEDARQIKNYLRQEHRKVVGG